MKTKNLLSLAFLVTIGFSSCNQEEPTTKQVETQLVSNDELEIKAPNFTLNNIHLNEGRSASNQYREQTLLTGEDGRSIIFTETGKGVYLLTLLNYQNKEVARLSATISNDLLIVKNNVGNTLFQGRILGDKLRLLSSSTGMPLIEGSLRAWGDVSTASKICTASMAVIGVGAATIGAIPTGGLSAFGFGLIYGGLTSLICDGW